VRETLYCVENGVSACNHYVLGDVRLLKKVTNHFPSPYSSDKLVTLY
jgi:hypothetical protein